MSTSNVPAIVMVPELVIAPPEKVSPVVPPETSIEVTVPALVVNPLSLLKILSPISEAAFLLSAPASKTMNSSVLTIVAVISVNSDKSRVMEGVVVPLVTSRPVPTDTEVTVPVVVE